MRKCSRLFWIVASVVIAMGLSVDARAIEACHDPAVVLQPDGSKITVLLHGDEWVSYSTTADGYTIVKDADGFYKYAELSGGQLVPSARVAHEAALRSAAERQWLQSVGRNLAPSAEAQRALRAKRKLHGSTHYDYKNFRGLVILVEYNDCPFAYENAHDLFYDMINKPDYDGYMSNATFAEKVPCTGSVRDYFYASSGGKFDPHFDVVGPVKINYSQYYACKSSGASVLVSAALDAADSLVNYKDYDCDGNLQVDMVYFIFSGGGSNFSGNDSRLLWPHASTLYSTSHDGVTFGRYACSTELYGRPESQIIDGIGTMCHEFSHVLGVADLYDTDGTSSGGQSVVPGRWSLMSQGSYLNQSRTPPLYSAYERYAAGFTTPCIIKEEGHYDLEPITTWNNGFRINSNVENEFFIVENRKKEGFDAFLPGEGMLVWRVDSTNVDVWENNKVNCNPAHNYYELLRAGGSTGTGAASDPFPGTNGATEIDNSTTPSLKSWTGRNTSYWLHNIERNDDSGNVTFVLSVQPYKDELEDFEDMALTTTDVTGKAGKFLSWALKNSARIDVTVENGGKGDKACSMLRNSELLSAALPWQAESMSFDFYNPTTQTAVVRVYTRATSSAAWATISTTEGLDNTSVAAGGHVSVQFNKVLPAGTEVRIVEYSGNRTSRCYLDNIAFTVKGDIATDVRDVETEQSPTAEGTYDLMGRKVEHPERGIYIKDGKKVILF